MTQPIFDQCDCVAGCQSRSRLCPNLAEPEQAPPVAAYLTRHDDGDMLFFDEAEAQRYCEDDSEPEPLVLLSAIAQPEQTTSEWHELTDLDRQQVFESLPDMLDGFLKTWGWLHFAKGIEAKCREKNIAQPEQTVVNDFDFRESVGLMLAAVGYTEDYARQWPKEKVSITFKRWFDEQIAAAKAIAQPEQTTKPYAYAIYFPDQQNEELVHELDDACEAMTNDENHVVTPLYEHPPTHRAAKGQAMITAEDCVRALKTHRLSTTAKCLARFVGADSRAVATALRKPTQDGRVSMTYKKGIGFYRFVRLTPKETK